MLRRPPRSTLFPTRRSSDLDRDGMARRADAAGMGPVARPLDAAPETAGDAEDRKSTRLNSSHMSISYAVFCLKKKTVLNHTRTPFTPAPPPHTRRPAVDLDP